GTGSSTAVSGTSSLRSSSDVLARPTRDTNLLAVLADAVAHPGRLAVGIDDHHVRDVDGGLLGDDPAGLGTTLGLGDSGVLLDPVDTLNQHTLACRIGLDHLALGALVLACDDEDRVALLHLHSEHLRRERDDLHELPIAQLAANRPEDACASRFVVVLDEHRGVLVEPNVGAVGATLLLRGPDNHGPDDVTTLHVGARDGVLDGGDDDVTDTRVAPPRATEHPDGQDLLGTRVVGDSQSRLLLDHVNSCMSRRFSVSPSLAERTGLSVAPDYLAFSRISTSRHRLVADSGRVSMSRTRSPTPAVFCSSCAFTFLVVRMTLPYSGCFFRSSSSTTIVLSILSDTTRPSRTFR